MYCAYLIQIRLCFHNVQTMKELFEKGTLKNNLSLIHEVNLFEKILFNVVKTILT